MKSVIKSAYPVVKLRNLHPNLFTLKMESEQKLIEEAKEDKTAFIKLYDKYFNRIYGYALSRVADKELAEDITSETFMSALENLNRYEYKGKPFSAWLYRIAINKITDHYRMKKAESEAAMQKWRETEDMFDGADEELKKNESETEKISRLKELHVAFQKLNPVEQNLISLKYYEDLSYKEIAEILDTNTSNIGVKLNRAMARLTQLCNYISS